MDLFSILITFSTGFSIGTIICGITILFVLKPDIKIIPRYQRTPYGIYYFLNSYISICVFGIVLFKFLIQIDRNGNYRCRLI